MRNKKEDYTPSEALWSLGQAITDYAKRSKPFEEGDGVFAMSERADDIARMFLNYADLCRELGHFYDISARKKKDE